MKNRVISLVDVYPPRPPVSRQESPGGFSLPKKPKLREDWPFLADPSCPPELKILVSQKITAYHSYCDAHKQLFDCTNLEQQFAAVKQLVESFIDNQAIFHELHHYKQHGRVLGNHQIFETYRQIKALRKLSDIDLYKKKEKLEHNIWRLRSVLDNPKQQHLRVQREKLITHKESELAEIDRLLNL